MRIWRLVSQEHDRRAPGWHKVRRLQLRHDSFHDFCAVATGRTLRRPPRSAASAHERARLHAQARAGRNLLVHRIERRGLFRIQAADSRCPYLPVGTGQEFQRRRCAGHQGNREDHQPRREGRGVLDQVEIRCPARAQSRERVRAFRVHQRRHQQHEPRTSTQGRARAGHASRSGCGDHQAAFFGTRPCGRAHAQPHAKRLPTSNCWAR